MRCVRKSSGRRSTGTASTSAADRNGIARMSGSYVPIMHRITAPCIISSSFSRSRFRSDKDKAITSASVQALCWMRYCFICSATPSLVVQSVTITFFGECHSAPSDSAAIR